MSTVAGVVVFLAFLLFAVQLTFDLSATSAVSAAALDAARTVASRDVDHADADAVREAQVDGERRARSELGRLGNRATFTWRVDDDDVQLRVQVTNPRFLPPGLDRPVGFDRIDRTVSIRVERVR
ncbi:MAG TPA: hypothetical protein VGM93_08760 [Acidimicrobiales bacterium]